MNRSHDKNTKNMKDQASNFSTKPTIPVEMFVNQNYIYIYIYQLQDTEIK